MPLSPDELVSLGPKAIALMTSIGRAVSADSEGGRRITRAEGRKLLRLAAELVVELARDALD